MTWRIDGPQGNESAKVKWDIVEYTKGRGLDLGCGPFKAFSHFIGVDNGHHAQEFGWNYKPDIHVETCEKLDLFTSNSMDFVFSSHLLEHIKKYEEALREWWRVVKMGGYLCLYLPHKNFYPNIGREGANPDHKHDFLPEDIIKAMQHVPNAWDLIVNEERNEGDEYSFFQVYKKIGGAKLKESWKEPKPAKTCAVVRYGAWGDLMQASSVFPGIKEQGYHITLITVPNGWDIVKHDPHIDHVIVQDKDQVPNQDLSDYWEWMGKKYDKVVNLSESVEGTFLALPGRANHRWPLEIRQKYLNKNYLEFAHELAGIPYKPAQKFYPTLEEKAWARKERDKNKGPVILWSLAGSGVHKTWPYLDQIIARLLLTYKDAVIYLVGDVLCQMLESGWEKEPRVIRKSGKWNMRETLSFAQIADMVIGPETGVLNAVAFEDVPKVITLSHSSENNLTRDWKNVYPLTPKNTDCYPCHILHYGYKYCRKDEETGCAACQVDITADQMWEQIVKILGK